MAGDWAELPPELVESISKRFTVYADYLRFRSVCPNWQSSVPETPLHLPPQRPVLIVSPSTFFDLSTTKTHHLPLNIPSFGICGSSHGWLVTLNKTPHVRLLNPITLASLELPSIDSFDVGFFNCANIDQEDSIINPLSDFNILRLMEMDSFFPRKVVLSSNPSQNDHFVAFALAHEHKLAFCKKGSNAWVLLSGEHYSWEDIVHREENGLFYAVSKEGTIAVCDVESSSEPRIQIVHIVAPGQFSGDIHYAVFSGNDLLLVTQVLNQEARGEPNQVGRAVGFEVFKMDWSELKWDKIETLGDKVLIVGGNSSLSFSASDFGGCFEADCIYFAAHYPESNHNDTCRNHDIGIFRLRDQSIEPLHCYPAPSSSELGSSLPIWLTPNPC